MGKRIYDKCGYPDWKGTQDDEYICNEGDPLDIGYYSGDYFEKLLEERAYQEWAAEQEYI